MAGSETGRNPKGPGCAGSRGAVLLVVNPRSGRPGAGRSRRILEYLRADGRDVTTVETRGRGDARRAAAEAAPDTSLVVAAGGDGTVNEVVTGLAGRDVPVAIVPLGTANILARAAGIPCGIEAACRVALAGRTRRLDVGCAGRGRFAGIASAGFDAAVVHGFARRREGYSSLSKYLVPLFAALCRYRYPPIAVECDGEVVSRRAAQVFIANTPTYGGPAEPTPYARPDDGLLDVCLFTGRGPAALTAFGLATLLGAHGLTPGLWMFRARRVRLEGAGRVPVEFDGDAYGTLPLAVEVAPAALKLVVP